MIDMEPGTNPAENIAAELRAWHTTGLRIAIWGGAGESAAFLETYRMDAQQFPIVVDSDPTKAGTFVPGTGQTIRSHRWLIENPVDIILIPCRRQAVDIVHQIDAVHITYEGILIPHEGHLVDFHAAEVILA